MSVDVRARKLASSADKLLSHGPLHYLFSNTTMRDDRIDATEKYIRAGEIMLAESPAAALLYFNAATDVAERYEMSGSSISFTLQRLYFRIAQMSREMKKPPQLVADYCAKAEKFALEKPDYSGAAKICEWLGDDGSLTRARNYYTICGQPIAAAHCTRKRAELAVMNGNYSTAAALFAEMPVTVLSKYGHHHNFEQVLCHLIIGDVVAAKKIPGYGAVVDAFCDGDVDEFMEVVRRLTTPSMRSQECIERLLEEAEKVMEALAAEEVL